MTKIQKALLSVAGAAVTMALTGWLAMGLELLTQPLPLPMKLIVVGFSIALPCGIASIAILIIKDQI